MSTFPALSSTKMSASLLGELLPVSVHQLADPHPACPVVYAKKLSAPEAGGQSAAEAPAEASVFHEITAGIASPNATQNRSGECTRDYQVVWCGQWCRATI